jgi:hypothetical protein
MKDAPNPERCGDPERVALRSPAGSTASWLLASLGFFVALAVVHTWPLASAPGVLSRNDNGDTVLHEWILAWVAHQLVSDPLRLFDANIFYPERHTLAYSDHLIVQSLMGAPLAWAGFSPVLVHNVVLIAGYALTGWTTALVVARWTGSRAAGLLSGSLVAFSAFTLTRLPQIQDLHFEFFPLVLLALDRLLVYGRVRDALALAGWYVLQSLTGTYLMVFTAISIIAATLARPRDWLGARFAVVAPKAALAATVAVAALTPFLLPYLAASREVGLSRSLEETARYSAELTDYLAAAGTFHFEAWSRRFWQGDGLFPGLMALILAAGAIGLGPGVTDRRIRMVLVMGVVAFALSFGPAFPPYRWLYNVFPLLTGIRGAVRLGQIVIAAVGILAGFGLAAILGRAPGRAAAPIAIAVILAANLEAFRAPINYTEYRGIPEFYDALRHAGDEAVVVSMPFYAGPQFHLNDRFMLASTRFWKPMLNGYSGFKPASFYKNVEALRGFPDEGSIAHLQAVGVTHVVVDGRNMAPAALERLERFPELRTLTSDGTLRLYLLTRAN